MSVAETTVKSGRSVWGPVGAIVLGLLLPALAAAVPAMIAFYPVGAFFPIPELGLGSAVQAIKYAAIGFVVIAMAAVIYLRTMRPVFLAFVVGIGMLIGFLPGLFGYFAARDFGLYLLTPRSERLIGAIASYEKLHGQPPARLEDLVPEFLPAVPGTGMPAFPKYLYQASTGPCSLKDKWSLVVRLKGEYSDEFIYYCPLQGYDLESLQGNVGTTERERIGDWAYSYTDFDD